MPKSASASSLMAIALLSVGAEAQQIPTPEEEVIAMLREWRALRAAQVAETPPVPVESPGPAVRIRVGKNVQQAALTSGAQPSYPEEARANGVEGVVTLEAVIAADGTVQSVTAIDGDPLLAPAAIESVKGWTYRPTLLNGVPAEVQTRIEVNFTLQEQGAPRRTPRKKL